MVKRLITNTEETPPTSIPESIYFRGFNTRGYSYPKHGLSVEGHALRDKIDTFSNEYLAAHGCTVLARHSAPGTGLKGAVSTVEHDAFATNYRGLVKLVADAYRMPLQKESLCLPSLGDGMVVAVDTILITKLLASGLTIFTTIDHLCVNPKACYEIPAGSLYSQMVGKQRAFLREGPSRILKRLDNQLELENTLYEEDPERYPDALTNAYTLACLKNSLANGLAEALHIVALDTMCDQHTHDEIVAYLQGRVDKEVGAGEQPTVKFIGAARAPLGTSQEDLHNAMVTGHSKFFSPTNIAEAAMY